jgi:hypothetical protein
MTEAADRFVDLACLTYRDDESRLRRTEASALLAATPELVHASVHAAAAAGDLGALRGHVDRDARCVEERGTPRGWVPLLALCYSRVEQPDALGCLDLLLARGADPDAHVILDQCRFTALTGVMGEGEAGPFEQPPHPQARAMAERLLDAGADPDDAQGLYDTHFLPDDTWLELLLARGLTIELDFLLGQAAVQGFAERVQLLLAHGADPDGRNRYNRRRHLENALLEGHRAVAARLRAAGAGAPELSALERFDVAVLDNDPAEARRILAESPSAAARPDALLAAARHGRLDVLRLGLDLGLPIDGLDAAGLTPLHHAARSGHLDVVRELVARGASLAVRDALHDGTPLGHARHFTERWPSLHGAEVVAFLEERTRG